MNGSEDKHSKIIFQNYSLKYTDTVLEFSKSEAVKLSLMSITHILSVI